MGCGASRVVSQNTLTPEYTAAIDALVGAARARLRLPDTELIKLEQQ